MVGVSLIIAIMLARCLNSYKPFPINYFRGAGISNSLFRSFCQNSDPIGWTSIKLSPSEANVLDEELGVPRTNVTGSYNRKTLVTSSTNVIDAKVKGFLEINPVVCSGCGAPFQSKTIDAPGKWIVYLFIYFC